VVFCTGSVQTNRGVSGRVLAVTCRRLDRDLRFTTATCERAD